MPLPFPNLDDRNFDQLLADARALIEKNPNGQWTDLSPGDPGIVLLEAFAYLTDQMIYRLNRLPSKVYRAFLRLLGVTIQPPTAARVTLHVWQKEQSQETIYSLQRDCIPLLRGTRVTTAGNGMPESGEHPVFITASDLDIPACKEGIRQVAAITAYHCEQVEESLGKSQGEYGQSFQVKRPPIVARLPPDATWLDLAVGVEVPKPQIITNRHRAGLDGKMYYLWMEVENFLESFAPQKLLKECYMVDRQAGIIYFAPAARLSGEVSVHPLASVPPAGREIRVWYPRGGGAGGNVQAGQLNRLIDVPSGIEVINPERASGGLDAETLENALVRGPQEIRAHHRAVTADEFQKIVLDKGLASRARAVAQASLWKHGVPGTVDIVMVPMLPEAEATDKEPLLDRLLACQQNQILAEVRTALAESSPICIEINPRWARYKKVWIEANLTYQGEEDPDTIQKRVTQRLDKLISPLPEEPAKERDAEEYPLYPGGWPFGQPLRAADVYTQIMAGEGTRYPITSLELSLHVEHAPNEDITCLAADLHQPKTWYAGSGRRLFRSTNDGSGWELILDLTKDTKNPVKQRSAGGNWSFMPQERDEIVRHICPSPDRCGMVAVSTEAGGEGSLESVIYLSVDCGESWYRLDILHHASTALHPGAIEDMAWLTRRDRSILLLATDSGLLEEDVEFDHDGSPTGSLYYVPVLVDKPMHPLHALAILPCGRGGDLVAVALKGRRGVFYATGDSLGRYDKLLKGAAVDVAGGDGRAGKSGTSFVPLRMGGETYRRGEAAAPPVKELGRQEDIRHLKAQKLDDRVRLWAAARAVNDNGRGCYCWQFNNAGELINEGAWVSENWYGGSCLALTFDDQLVYAATYRGGVLRAVLDKEHPDRLPVWERFAQQEVRDQPQPHIYDLPLRQTQIEGTSKDCEALIAIDARDGVVMVANRNGIYRRSREPNILPYQPVFAYERFELVSRATVHDAITIPRDWLLVPGQYKIRATRHDTRRALDAAPDGRIRKKEFHHPKKAQEVVQPAAPDTAPDAPVQPAHPAGEAATP